MTNQVNKKVQSFFFVIIALTQFVFIMSMKPDQPEKIETTCIYVPQEILSQIFQYFAQRTMNGNPDIKSSLVLRLVSKDFKETIDDYPCFLAPPSFDESDNTPRFLHFSLEMLHNHNIVNIVKLYNKNVAEKFLSFFSHFFSGDIFRISMKLDEGDINTFLPSYLKTLLSLLNQVGLMLKIDTSSISKIRLWKRREENSLKLSFLQSYTNPTN